MKKWLSAAIRVVASQCRLALAGFRSSAAYPKTTTQSNADCRHTAAWQPRLGGAASFRNRARSSPTTSGNHSPQGFLASSAAAHQPTDLVPAVVALNARIWPNNIVGFGTYPAVIGHSHGGTGRTSTRNAGKYRAPAALAPVVSGHHFDGACGAYQPIRKWLSRPPTSPACRRIQWSASPVQLVDSLGRKHARVAQAGHCS